MSDIKVLTLWDGDKIDEKAAKFLRAPCKDIAIPLDEEGKKAIAFLIEAFLERDDALGLAAPQVGMGGRIVVFRNKGFDDKEKWTKTESDYDVLVNPRITQARGEKVLMAEGCLSCPEIQVEIERFPEIKVRGYDAQGRKINKRYTDFLARIIQHELDHLEGKLIIDHEGTMYTSKKKQDFFQQLFQES
jgi:peptide deformylase